MAQIIDFSGVFANLENVITAAVVALIEAIKGKDAKGLSDMREQILANAKAMWPMTQVYDRSSRIEALPDFDVILMGQESNFGAAVVYEAINDAEKFVYIKGGQAKNAEEAMHKLLETSMAMMRLLYPEFVVELNGRGSTKGGEWFAPGF